ncbi:MAG TPA: DNA-processing protein DprA [Burkholderiaceae bacterium]|nr:DNA-processing protein DprA [Burkholderiaceae bacterium]
MGIAEGEADELAHWLRLALTPGVGPVAARRLLDRFGLPDAIFHASEAAVREAVGPRLADALRRPDAARERAIEASLEWASHDAHHLVTLADADYPASLLEIADPPALLWLRGRREAIARPMLAIVGARNATAAGTAHARAFGHALSAAGWTIASGLALGIDAAAHAGALDGGAGTVAVLGTGIDVVYPSRHETLAGRIAADGALLSELPPGTAPTPGGFPRRNRLIAGLSRGVLVVEAALRSGSLITARHAAEAGREVFAIPGSIHSPLARGCHALLREGAKLVETAEDVLAELPPSRRDARAGEAARPEAGAPGVGPGTIARSGPPTFGGPPGGRADGPDRDPVLVAIGHEPVLPDALAARLELPSGELGARLVMLELAGRLLRLPDGRVVRPPPVG